MFWVQSQNPFTTLTYDSLVIYDFDWRGRGVRYTSIIDENGNLPPTVKKSVKLSEKETSELSRRIGAKESYGQITASCFDPHFGMVYYHNGEIKAHVTICLACNYPSSSLEIPARNQGKEEFDGKEYYTKTGFSTPMRKYLSALKKKYGFSHSNIESDIFDKE